MIIGFNGPPKSGKTEAAQYIVKKYGAVELNFGDDMKEELFDALREDTPPQEFAFLPNSVRQQALKTIDALDYGFANGVIEVPPYDCTREEKIAWCNKYKDIIRPLLQIWAHEYRRAMDPDYWVKKWQTRASTALEQGFSVACGDVRYANEIAAIESLGGSWCRIVSDAQGGSHASDNQQLPEPPAEILNDRTDRFYRLVDYTVEKFKNGRKLAA